MKSRLIFSGIIVFFLCFAYVSALDLEIEKISKGDVVIAELRNPAIFDFIIKNKGAADNVEIYSLVGVSMTPKGTFSIPSGESTTEVWAYLGEDYLKREGLYSFQYQIKGNQGIFEDKLTVQVVHLQDIFIIEQMKIHPDDEIANLTIKNVVNSNLENVEIQFSSAFFDSTKKINFKPFEEVDVLIVIERKSSRLRAGSYPLEIKINVDDSSVKLEGTINYLEKEGTSVIKESTGFLIIKSLIKEVNEGNIPVTSTIEIKKDIISRLFTGYSIAPLEVERSGVVVDYKWERELQPGESFSVVATTNYTFIVLFMALVILFAFGVRFYTTKALTLNKSVSFVKTKGGEFALKVRINAKGGRTVSNVQITDMLPAMAKLYNGFGKPDKIDEANKKLFWNIPHLNRGEERVFSYIIYSKLRAVGRFELPAAMAIFDSEGKRDNVMSNRAYFVSETMAENAQN